MQRRGPKALGRSAGLSPRRAATGESKMGLEARGAGRLPRTLAIRGWPSVTPTADRCEQLQEWPLDGPTLETRRAAAKHLGKTPVRSVPIRAWGRVAAKRSHRSGARSLLLRSPMSMPSPTFVARVLIFHSCLLLPWMWIGISADGAPPEPPSKALGVAIPLQSLRRARSAACRGAPLDRLLVGRSDLKMAFHCRRRRPQDLWGAAGSVRGLARRKAGLSCGERPLG